MVFTKNSLCYPIRLWEITQTELKLLGGRKKAIFLYVIVLLQKWDDTETTKQQWPYSAFVTMFLANRTVNASKTFKHLNAALLIMLTIFSKSWNLGRPLYTLTHFSTSCWHIQNTEKYNLRVSMQPFRVKVSGSFLYFILPTDTPKRESHSNHNRIYIPLGIHHHATQGKPVYPICWNSRFPGNANLLQHCGSAGTVPKKRLSRF